MTETQTSLKKERKFDLALFEFLQNLKVLVHLSQAITHKSLLFVKARRTDLPAHVQLELVLRHLQGLCVHALDEGQSTA